jgi:hypothetical protein
MSSQLTIAAGSTFIVREMGMVEFFTNRDCGKGVKNNIMNKITNLLYKEL